jgi:multiple sugar transport system permease protein
MTKGGPGNATRVYYFYLYENAFRFYRMGYASAMAYVLFCITFLLTFIQMRFSERFITYEIA